MKHLKMMLYGEPGVGKSTFASKAPNPFFITTDGNYEFLEDFGAKPEAHIQVRNWRECLKAFSQPYDEYDTIVVDLLEDTFKMCENDFCTEKKIDHVSDLGYGKGYDMSRNSFYIGIMKLLSREDKNIILLMHGTTTVIKDRRGVEKTLYAPTNRLPDKVADVLEGAVRYCLRCYVKTELDKEKFVKRRYLKLVPEEGEFGIARGLDENKVPSDIPLDFDVFAKIIGLEIKNKQKVKEKEIIQNKKVEEEKVEEEVKKEKVKKEPVKNSSEQQFEPVVNNKVESKEKEIKKEENISQENHEEMSAQDRIAAIKAKIEALKNRNK